MLVQEGQIPLEEELLEEELLLEEEEACPLLEEEDTLQLGSGYPAPGPQFPNASQHSATDPAQITWKLAGDEQCNFPSQHFGIHVLPLMFTQVKQPLLEEDDEDDDDDDELLVKHCPFTMVEPDTHLGDVEFIQALV